MLDIKDFSVFDQASFDFKLLKNWKLLEMVLLSLIITFTIAYQVNIRKSIAWKRLFCKGRKQSFVYVKYESCF
jgi:hypothetical protein